MNIIEQIGLIFLMLLGIFLIVIGLNKDELLFVTGGLIALLSLNSLRIDNINYRLKKLEPKVQRLE